MPRDRAIEKDGVFDAVEAYEAGVGDLLAVYDDVSTHYYVSADAAMFYNPRFVVTAGSSVARADVG